MPTSCDTTTIDCAACGKSTEKPEITGSRMIAGNLVSYGICRTCVRQAQPAALGYQQGLNERKNFWLKVWEKLELKHGGA